MARIRTIKPEFWQDEKLAPLEPIHRLVFLGLISQADDAGRLVDNARLIDGLLFPATDHSSRESIETLTRIGRILRYTSESGQALIQISNWERHQRVVNPSKYVLPAPSPEDIEAQEVIESSLDPNESLNRTEIDSRSPIPDLRPTTNDQRPTSKEEGKNAPPIPAQGIVDAWNETCGEVLPRVRHLTDKRRRQIGVRCRDLRSVVGDQALDPEWWAREIFSKVRSSPFCRGENPRGWKASLDWIMDRKDAAVKALEGQYDDTESVDSRVADRYSALG